MKNIYKKRSLVAVNLSWTLSNCSFVCDDDFVSCSEYYVPLPVKKPPHPTSESSSDTEDSEPETPVICLRLIVCIA